MKIILNLICLALLVNLSAQKVTVLYNQEGISFRGLDQIDNQHIWASGNKGTVIKSTNGGKTWKDVSPKGYNKIDFRDIELIDQRTAVILGVASPGVILKTKDAGKTWQEVYRDESPEVFMDAMHRKGSKLFLVGDAIDDSRLPYFLESKNMGDSWTRYSPQKKAEQKNLKLKDGEAFFASSGQNVQIIDSLTVVYVSGGRSSNIYWWERNFIRKSVLPLAQGNDTAGANALAFHPEKKFGFVVGGDYRNKTYDNGNITRFEISNYGTFRITAPKKRPFGYQSSVAYGPKKYWISCGLNGVYLSKDDGENWKKISSTPFHSVNANEKSSVAYLTGSDGRIAKINLP